MQAAIGRTIIIYKAQHAYSSHACITRLPDGDWLVAFTQSLQRIPYQHPPGDPQFLDFITRSQDLGESWDAPRVAPGYDLLLQIRPRQHELGFRAAGGVLARLLSDAGLLRSV